MIDLVIIISIIFFTVNLFDLEKTQKYEVKSVLTKPNDDKYCTLLIKRERG